MLRKIAALAVFLSMLAAGAGKAPPEGRASNGAVEITAKLYNGKEAVRQVMGSDLGGYIVVVDVRVTPQTSEALAVHPDDFLLRSDKDGQKSPSLTPSQIAGKGALVISEGRGGGAIMADNTGPVWGGYPTGRPGRLGGDGGAMGNASTSTPEAAVHAGSKDKEDPLLATLKSKALPEIRTDKTVAGLLYFMMDGKHKTNQLEMQYRGAAGRLAIRFRD